MGFIEKGETIKEEIESEWGISVEGYNQSDWFYAIRIDKERLIKVYRNIIQFIDLTLAHDHTKVGSWSEIKPLLGEYLRGGG